MDIMEVEQSITHTNLQKDRTTSLEKQDSAISLSTDITDTKSTCTDHADDARSEVRQPVSGRRRQNGSTRSRSMSDITTTSRTSRSPWLRDPTADAKPITDTTLRKKLPSARTPGTRITARDQKILELMLAKREEEQKLNHQRQASKLQWEKEREAEGLAKTHEENWRRRSLSDLRRNKEMKRMEVETRKRQEEEAAREERKQAADFSHKQWQMHLLKQKEMREQRAQEKREQNMQRKKSQEKRLEQQRKESEEFIEEVKRHQAATIRRANTMKEVREREQALAKRLANTKVKRRHSEKWDTIKKKSEEEAEQLQQMLEDKHKAVMSNYERMQQRRQEEIKKSQYDLQKKIHRARSAQKTLEEEMAAWYDNLMDYRKQMEDRAQEAAQEAAFLKSKKVQEERIAKLQMQQENLKRMLEQEEEWKNDVEASLALKESRVHMLQREKEEKVEESRQIAQASQRLREELKDQYSEDKLDQMMRRAEIEARIGAGVHSATKNMSTLTLG